MLADTKEILRSAQRGKYAVGAFNASNMETLQGIVMAAVQRKSPMIIQLTESAMKYAGAREIAEIAKIVIKDRSENVPIGLNLDHGKTFEIIRKAVDLGFTEVMIDGSRLSFEDNKNLTKRVVNFAHSKGLSVQAELGIVPYLGEIDISEVNWESLMTDPDRAKDFVESTKVDFLAVAIGNAHGFFREPERCDWERLKRIRKKVTIPLVLHGASDWSKDKIDMAINGGVSCFNVDTDIRLAFMHQLCKLVDDKCTITDPRKVMEPIREAIKNKVIEKINIFGSAMKA